MAMTMQPDLPWNVAGIAPEAREAARTSARREGLSVGEWLTRRILRGLAENEAAADEWWLAETSRARTPSNENPIASTHPGNDDRVRQLVQRPNATRYNQTESKGASGGASAPIKFAAPKESENLRQLSDRVVRLDARIARIEFRVAAEEAKHGETVKALQAKMAELAEQTSKAAARSAALGTQLANTVEAVSGKFRQSQEETDEQRSAMDARISAIAEDSSSLCAKLEETQDTSERQLGAVEQRIAATELAIEAGRRDQDAADRLGGSLDHLTRRFEASEAEYLNNIERFENRLTRIEANPGEAVIDRRLQGIEQALADMAKLIEKNAPEKTAKTETLDQPRLADPQSDAAQQRVAPHYAEPFGAGAATPILDLPPFPEKPRSSFTAPPPDSIAGSPASDVRASALSATALEDAAKSPIRADVESFLAAARRSANAGNSAQPRKAAFSWVDPAGQAQATEATHTRPVLLGGIGLLVLAAVGTGLYLSNNFSYAPTTLRIAPKPAHHAAMATSERPQPALVQPRATLPIASPTSAPKPVATAPATATRILPGATQTKPLTSLERLAALAGTGNVKAQEVLGLAYLDGDGVSVNEAEGAKWLERAAAGGEPVAAYRLGTLYERGHGVAADRAKATQWYAVAAKAGNRKAMHNLAVAYAQGSGVQKDLPLAAQWFSRASGLGLPDSQFNLAVLYERGMGVPQSLSEAYKWYAIAAAQGDAESRTRMDAIASQISARDKLAAEKAAAAFHPSPLERAANSPPIAASLLGG